MTVLPAEPADFAWLATRTSCSISEYFQAIKAVDDQGRIHGMVGYDTWTPNGVTMCVALDNPAAARSLLYPAFACPFIAGNRGVAVAHVLSTNEQALRLDKHLGFKEVGRLRDAWAVGVDVVLLELRKEDCRFLRHKE